MRRSQIPCTKAPTPSYHQILVKRVLIQIHRCLARLVARASELQVDLRPCGSLERFPGSDVESVGYKTVGAEALRIGAPSYPSRGHAFDQRGAQRLPWAVCALLGRSGTDRSQIGVSECDHFRKRSLQKASTSESEHFRKRAHTLESEHFGKRALRKASTSERERFRKSEHFRKRSQIRKREHTSEREHTT